MIEQRSLADIIQSKVALGSANARGFFDVRCAVCHDAKARGGFKFDTETTGYSCYNCSARFRYEEGSGKLSKNAKEVLEAFGISRDDLTALPSSLLSPKVQTEADITLQEMRKVKLHTPEVPLPARSFPIGHDGHEELQLPIAEYLLSRRIDIDKVRPYFSLEPRFLRRAILPYWRDGRMIYWQARAIDDDIKPRYLNSPATRDAVMWGYDNLFTWSPKPLFAAEGAFDAAVLDGICLLGSSLNEAKVEVLKRSRRRIIFIMDQDKTGDHLASQALDNGWEITYLDKTGMDANKSVQEYGLPYTIYVLLKNATRDRVKLSMGHLNARLQGSFR